MLTPYKLRDYRSSRRWPSEMGLAAVVRAWGDLGEGETIKNNWGPYVRSLRGKLNTWGQGAWCAAAVYTWVSAGALDIGSNWKVARTHSARRLVARYLEHGAFAVSNPLPGDIVLWSRRLPWQGHTGIVCAVSDQGTFHTVEGNRGRFPAKVSVFEHSLSDARLVKIIRLP